MNPNIKFVRGDIFNSDAHVYVNPVNTQGVMGKGLALKYATHFPSMVESYRKYCEEGRLSTGNIHVYVTPGMSVPLFIVNLPTKEKWYRPSKLEYVDSGLGALMEFLVDADYPTVAIPALGCGLGNLDWADVKPCIERHLEYYPSEVIVYEPL